MATTQAPPVSGKASLTLSINGTKYKVLPGTDRNNWSLRLLKADGTTYIVRHNQAGKWCSCPDFAERRRDGGCKHLKALAAWGL